MIRALVTLVIIGAACASLLVGTDALTRDDIRTQRQARERALAEEMLGLALPATIDLQTARFGDCPSWYFGRFSVSGYAGPIEALALWRSNATPPGLSLRVTSHRETPGIGDFIDHRRNAWLPARDGFTSTQWSQADAVSGATVTSQALARLAEEAGNTLSREVQSCE